MSAHVRLMAKQQFQRNLVMSVITQDIVSKCSNKLINLCMAVESHHNSYYTTTELPVVAEGKF